MSNVVSMFARKQHERQIKQWQDWLTEQLFWQMMIDRSLDEADIVHALGYPECEHQIFAYRQWVKDNQSLFETNTPMEVLNIAGKQLTQRCERYFQGYCWCRPDQFER